MRSARVLLLLVMVFAFLAATSTAYTEEVESNRDIKDLLKFKGNNAILSLWRTTDTKVVSLVSLKDGKVLIRKISDDLMVETESFYISDLREIVFRESPYSISSEQSSFITRSFGRISLTSTDKIISHFEYVAVFCAKTDTFRTLLGRLGGFGNRPGGPDGDKLRDRFAFSVAFRVFLGLGLIKDYAPEFNFPSDGGANNTSMSELKTLLDSLVAKREDIWKFFAPLKNNVLMKTQKDEIESLIKFPWGGMRPPDMGNPDDEGSNRPDRTGGRRNNPRRTKENE